jgi:hypothetical protein
MERGEECNLKLACQAEARRWLGGTPRQHERVAGVEDITRQALKSVTLSKRGVGVFWRRYTALCIETVL